VSPPAGTAGELQPVTDNEFRHVVPAEYLSYDIEDLEPGHEYIIRVITQLSYGTVNLKI